MSGQFIIVRSDALQDPELLNSPTAFMTLCAISTMTSQNKGGWCFFKQETIADRLGKSRQAVSRSLNKLKELGYLEIQYQSYQGRQSNNLYRLVYDVPLSTVQHDVAPMPQHDVAPSAQHDVAPKRPEYIKEEERETRGREWFLREIDKGITEERFSTPDLEHLTETEIKSAAEDCFGTWGNDLRGRDCPTVLRTWLKQGMKSGAVRKACKPSGKQEVKIPEPENPLQTWHERAAKIFDASVYQTWIRPLEHDGNGSVLAPTAFHADWVKGRYQHDIEKSIGNGVKIIPKPKEEQHV